MMEFESSPSEYPRIARGNGPLQWHLGGADPNKAFTMDGTTNNNPQSCGQAVNFGEFFATGDNDNVNFEWSADTGYVHDVQGRVAIPPQQHPEYVLDKKVGAQTAVIPLELEEVIITDGSFDGLQSVEQDSTIAYQEMAVFNPVLQDNCIIEPPHFPMAVESADNQAPSSMGQNFIDDYGQEFGSSVDANYPISSQPQINGLGISQIGFSQDNTLFDVPQEDETPQIGYTPLTAGPYMQNIVAPESFHNPPYNGHGNGSVTHSPYVPTEKFMGAPNFQHPGTVVQEIENILFEDRGANHTTPLIQQSPAFGLAVPDDHLLGGGSREGSIVHWESPRTPSRWDSSISPSPNPRAYVMPDPPLDAAFSHAMFGPFPADLGFSQPTLNDMMGNFDINTQPQLKKRKRKAFNPEDKKKVNQVRENGACVSCHARKIPCAVGGVCAGCLKTAGDPVLAQQICLRTKLKDVYKGVKDIHDTLDDRQRRLIPLLGSLTGEPKSVDLKVENPRLGYKFQLRLQVMRCTLSPSCRWKRLTKINGIYVTRDVIQDQRYVIVPTSLPSIDEYDHFGRQILATSNGSHSGGLTQLLDEFLLGFCKNSQPSRLRQFANYTLRVASLSRLVAYGFLNLYDGSYDLLDRNTGMSLTENAVTRRYVSETVHDQLRLLAAEGLEPVERLVFAEIDNLNKLFGKVRNGRIVSGICVLRLMLLYRDRVVRDSIRLELPKGGERHKKRLAKAAFMYKRLTIAYATLCRDITPLIMSWEPENDKDPAIEDLLMINLFSTLQPAFEEFCNEKVTSEYDELFKGLIIDASKIERRPSKKRKAEKGKARIVECHDC